MKYNTCFFERYASLVIREFLGERYANLENIDFHVNINYVSTKSTSTQEILRGLVGTNDGFIKNITITIPKQ